MSVTVHHGDCLDVLRGMGEASVDSVVTDPPYGLEFMSVGWDTFATPKGGARSDADFGDYGSKEHPRDARGQARVMRNKSRAFGQWCEAWAREVFRVLKPGGHAAIFGGTRTYHRLACAIEDAGFEIRDQLGWVYGTGFPKSLDVGKAIDNEARGDLARAKIIHFRELRGWSQRELGEACGFADAHKTVWDWEQGGHTPSDRNWRLARVALDVTAEEEARFEREAVGKGVAGLGKGSPAHGGGYRPEYFLTAPATEAARRWQGWGTALKPAWEPIVLARKPLACPTVAAQVLATGTGALNVDATRILAGESWGPSGDLAGGDSLRCYGDGLNNSGRSASHTAGRWPANLVLSYPDDQYVLKEDVTSEQKRELYRWLSENA